MSFYDGATVYTRTVATDISDQTWHHVAVTYNGTTAQLYIDGSAAGAALTASLNYATWSFFKVPGNEYYLDGFIDNVGYWHKCLDSDEVSALYAAENAGLEYPWE